MPFHKRIREGELFTKRVSQSIESTQPATTKKCTKPPSGPWVYEYREVSAYRCPAGLTDGFQWDLCEGVDMAKVIIDRLLCKFITFLQAGSKWTGEIQNLDKLNQELQLTCTIENKNYSTIGEIFFRLS